MEIELRTTQLAQSQERYDELRSDWDNNGSENIFNKLVKSFKSLKSGYEKLEDQYQEKLAEVLEEIREEHLSEYLKGNKIEIGTIEGIGPGLIEKLHHEHISSAYGISRKRLSGIDGFGQTRIDRLIEWKKEIKASFKFDKAHAISQSDLASIRKPFAQQASDIEVRLRQAPEELKICKIKTLQYRQKALRPLCDAAKELKQMAVNLSLFS